MTEDKIVLQSKLLELLADTNTDARLGRGRHYLAEAIIAQFPKHQQPSSHQIMAAVWSLISQGLAYLDYFQPAPENWSLRLTDAGIAAARDGAINPDHSGEYLKRLRALVPQASPIVLQYAQEAITTYNARCYLAGTVMLGVASEAAFLEMARSFGKWLPQGKEQQKFSEIIGSKRQNYLTKFSEFRKRIGKYKSQLPAELSDGMSLTLDSVLDLLRIYRNEAGHPTGKIVSRDDAFISLQMFTRYLQRLYSLKDYFDSNQVS